MLGESEIGLKVEELSLFHSNVTPFLNPASRIADFRTLIFLHGVTDETTGHK